MEAETKKSQQGYKKRKERERVIGVKICGIKTKSVRDVAIKAGADYLGFMFYKKSARCVDLATARSLRADVPAKIKVVAVVVDAGDDELAQIIEQVKPDMIQAHGSESPARIQEIRELYGCEVIKTIPVERAQDVVEARLYQDHADVILFDAQSPLKDDISGGTGRSFDWHILAEAELPSPLRWMLAGGLNVKNIAEAVRVSGAYCVDVSSGVESGLGEKDPCLVSEFLDMAKAL